MSTRKKDLGLWRRSAIEDQRTESNSCSARNSSLQVQSYTIWTISFKFNYCMLLALMKHCCQPSAEQSFHLLSPSLAIRLNGLIPTMTTEAEKMGACYGLTKYPCNRRHQIQLRCSFCDTHIECGVSFLHIYREIELWLKKALSRSLPSSKNFHSRKDERAYVQVDMDMHTATESF